MQYLFEDPNFDFVILGTDMKESIISAVIAHQTKRVLVIDQDHLYSGSLKCFHTRELAKIQANLQSTSIQKENLISNFEFFSESTEYTNLEECVQKVKWRGFSFEWDTKLISSDSQATEEMISLGIDNYINFRALREIYIGGIAANPVPLPLQKSAVLSSNGFSLMEKKRMYDIVMALQKLFKGLLRQEKDLNNIQEFQKDIYQTHDEQMIAEAGAVLDHHFADTIRAVEKSIFKSKATALIGGQISDIYLGLGEDLVS